MVVVATGAPGAQLAVIAIGSYIPQALAAVTLTDARFPTEFAHESRFFTNLQKAYL